MTHRIQRQDGVKINLDNVTPDAPRVVSPPPISLDPAAVTAAQRPAIAIPLQADKTRAHELRALQEAGARSRAELADGLTRGADVVETLRTALQKAYGRFPPADTTARALCVQLIAWCEQPQGSAQVRVLASSSDPGKAEYGAFKAVALALDAAIGKRQER